MRRYLKLILVILFPYSIILVLVCIFSGIIETVLKNFDFLVLLALPVLYIAALVSSVAFLITSLVKKRNAQELLHINMAIKLIHIPSYLIIFSLGLVSMMTIFTLGFTIVFIIWDCMTIVLSGLIGLGGVIRSLRENKLSKKAVVIHGILQFVFCADVISSIIIYKTVKRNSSLDSIERQKSVGDFA